VAASGAPDALAATWCGTSTTEDRPASVTGRSVRVVYAFPSDAPDRSAERAPLISADVDEMQTWWRTQDAEREPRFDRTGFACGLQVDLFVVRLQQDSATLRGDRFGHVAEGVLSVTGRSRFEKHLVYYDGPVDNLDLCGQGGGTPDGDGVAIVYLGACSGVPTAAVAAHELLHSFGALADSGPPHACPDTKAHPCDSPLDLLYFAASEAPLSGLVLDVGRDDYYGHAGAWLDVQDSRWLRLVTRQVSLTASILGKGSVESDVPGVDCAAACATEWDLGSVVTLEALAADGQRFVRWSGACTGSDDCDVTLSAALSVTALFAPERYGLVISLAGRGTVTGAGGTCRVARCRRSVTSYEPLRLRARAPVGWRFAGWSGGCRGVGALCTVRMEHATAVKARFVKR
jgi:hypothetical protein